MISPWGPSRRSNRPLSDCVGSDMHTTVVGFRVFGIQQQLQFIGCLCQIAWPIFVGTTMFCLRHIDLLSWMLMVDSVLCKLHVWGANTFIPASPWHGIEAFIWIHGFPAGKEPQMETLFISTVHWSSYLPLIIYSGLTLKNQSSITTLPHQAWHPRNNSVWLTIGLGNTCWLFVFSTLSLWPNTADIAAPPAKASTTSKSWAKWLEDVGISLKVKCWLAAAKLFL